MNKINILYWIFTGLLIPALGFGSVMEIMRNPDSIAIIKSLGYPEYLSPFLGVARILAIIAIVIPKFPRLKEWAYAGLVFDIIGAIYSQIAMHNPLTNIIFPAILLIIVFASYFLHHKRLETKI